MSQEQEEQDGFAIKRSVLTVSINLGDTTVVAVDDMDGKQKNWLEDLSDNFLIVHDDGTASPRRVVQDADGTTYPLLLLPSEYAGNRPNRHKQDPTSPVAVEQVATRFQARSNSDTEMEALLRWLIYKHYDNSKKSCAKKIRETSITFLTAFCRRRTRLYTSVRAGLEIQYKALDLQGVNHKQGFLLEIRREVAIQIDGVNSTEELENLPKAVQKPIARASRRCLRVYTNEKRLSLPDSDMNAIETLIADPKDDVQAFVNREAELSEIKALIDTGKLKGQKRQLALMLCKHPEWAVRGSVELGRELNWQPAHVRQVKRRLKIAANS